jgi:hypothetical protein
MGGICAARNAAEVTDVEAKPIRFVGGKGNIIA